MLQHAVQATDVNCKGTGGAAQITETGGTMPYAYTWSPNVATGPSATGLSAGAFAVTITDSHGCIDTAQFTIGASSGIQSVASIATNLTCHQGHDGSIVIDVAGGAKPLSYSWSPAGGNGPTATGLTAGHYYVTITDGVGCTAVDSVYLQEPPPLVARAHPVPVRCYGETTGMIVVDSVLGGTPPYLYAIGHTAFQTQPVFTGLAAGDYLIRFQDSLGCIDMDTVSILAPPQFSVSAGPDTTIYLGDPVFLNGIVTPPVKVLNVAWKPPVSISCNTCLHTQAFPLITTTYTVFVTDTNGCVVSDSRLVQIAQPPIYIPNVFDPSSDYLNDHFTVYAGTNVDEIELMQVYDRWGDLLFENRHFAASAPGLGWDGKVKGSSDAAAGVYVYVIKVKFTDGTSKVYSGDVTVVK
jgi:gliding motility-associated-like protein